jgi:hypothetical protein
MRAGSAKAGEAISGLCFSCTHFRECKLQQESRYFFALKDRVLLSYEYNYLQESSFSFGNSSKISCKSGKSNLSSQVGQASRLSFYEKLEKVTELLSYYNRLRDIPLKI